MATSPDQGTEVEMDMTPMIDVVFLMIIFFMIVSDLSQQDLAELTLPVAESAVKDETEEGRMIVNILGGEKSGDIEIKRKNWGSLDDGTAVAALRDYLFVEAEAGERESPNGPSERPLLIRCDEATEFKHVQKVMRICGEQGIQIYKIQLAAAQNEQP